MYYTAEDVKENISMDDVVLLLEEFNAEPKQYTNFIIAKTVCHNHDGSGSRKLYYYEENSSFYCYTECGSFDIIELVQKVKNIDFQNAIYFLINFFNLQWKVDGKDDFSYNAEDWNMFDRKQELRETVKAHEKFQFVELKQYDDSILKHYPQPIIKDWAESGITKEVCDFMNIRYDPLEGSILIPHYDQNSRLVGIRRRTLVKDEEQWGKYRPWQNVELYNHPLSFNLYGLEVAKWNIQKAGMAIVCEGEKAVLAYQSFFDIENDIAVAVCGSTFSKYQFELLRYYGAKEIVIAFDKDLHSIDDTENYQSFENKMKKIAAKFNARCNLSFIVDTDMNLLGYKDSPMDKGADVFAKLFKNRKFIV